MKKHPRSKNWENWSLILIPIELRRGTESMKKRGAPVGIGRRGKYSKFQLETLHDQQTEGTTWTVYVRKGVQRRKAIGSFSHSQELSERVSK